MRRLAWIMALALATAAANAQTTITVQVTGDVARPASIEFVGAPRLADALKTAMVERDAYVLGAAWLRPSLVKEQTRLKAGLIYELGEIREKAAADGSDGLVRLARSLREWIGKMPVTGRRVVRTLEPHALQVSASDNFQLEDGDRLIYPARPQSVSIVGAVQKACDVPQVGLADARSYLAQCEPSEYADADVVYVIEPDGNVFEQGVALWNRSPAMPVAPGAVLYVPLGRSATLHAADAEFNREMAKFLSSQPLGLSGSKQ